MEKGYGKNQCVVLRTKKSKIKYETISQAKGQAKLKNRTVNTDSQFIAYECQICHKFHIGKK